ncbi:MAG: bifunctional tRNA (5-methylaminomethyl-2-thiouridine)(34)-methyltransferase MnmD/FAD-dependent 5-carboxymethylaminomethyl-2-thiouridine(34) oxidoreductase MnmC [Alteromonas macleodii]|uniref:bifunctional tRNA (5-methylaminomethyl-2-thiouridine)(34)-methyltransferase MnmD/FAD-dependent 5-carboxymethylaminomethyl-2-thiouridine(34) oxidoreductase MnmC n=1 Tax=Alteromonas TaxID=226 RepID=UPI00127FA341|nr:bifunctional tRNA (5-methylaminomethyl-2-thiouridine)(34)-methyltransferase MnmD/FAD-dependent 5-carboxymethylaminomethyl-2-thiouridine(34) oxidoreductase MnmC [Alteromonas macleodii]MDM7961933.1 bifunctional tRNA (5-methylaminomethyl-2-thiouridine)(34)-methyltransferase MnmD/FAD-dependent 5-carboxymethylaminomethyl-2-thiouridine(34) oxidoreductase MnmC [Alteromonas macleodii]MDM8170384.1 bifunctional tRNA (5-methylaminomethyl-2-thiouridine)(34)-methyltransferase MnmD/FAD-dependent 5-carboxyme
MKSKHAQVHFNESGTPVADHFDDVYFSNDSGIDETQHVFVAGNDLAERWQQWRNPTFVIAETGFGTGLNFLVAMRAFNEFRAANPDHPLKRLYFITTEKFPLPQQDMQRALETFPALKNEAQALASLYPMGLEGCHRLHFDNHSTTLDLWIGDVHELLPQWHSPVNGLIDAWFLDGFAPSKNPDMWTDALFSQMARLSKTGTTFGTFTAAGIVKRGLAGVGFTIKKRNGFGRKRDMLTGVFNQDNENVQHKLRLPAGPYYRYANDSLDKTSKVAVVGSGLAAATACLALVKRGISTTLYFDGDTLASGASGNPQGGFYPQLHSEASIASRIQAHSFLYARQAYDHTIEHAKACGLADVAHDFCGVIQLSFNDKVAERQNKLAAADVWPEALIKPVDSKEVSDIANLALPYSGLYIGLGGWISPPQLVAAMIEEALQSGKLTLKPNHIYVSHEAAETTKQQVRIRFNLDSAENEEVITADHLILALGAGAVNASDFNSLSLRPVRGQVEAIPTQMPIEQLNTVLCHKGYMTPVFEGRHALGSTYVKNDLSTDVRGDETEMNLATHEQALANTDIVQALQHDGKARAATRLGSPDHQPVVGALHNFDSLKEHYTMLGVGKPLTSAPVLPSSVVSTLTCLGSRGLTTAPLMAEVLVSSLCKEPLPLSNDLLNAVNTSRFMTREAIRSQG